MLRYEKLFFKIIPKCFVKIIKMKLLISCNSNRLTRKNMENYQQIFSKQICVLDNMIGRGWIKYIICMSVCALCNYICV